MVRSKARLDAINSFRKKLEEGAVSDRAAQDLFTINVLLCMLDGMIEPERDLQASTFHLKGGIAMLSRWPNIVPNILQENGFQAHLLSVFATCHLVHSILSGSKPYFVWSQFADVRAWWGRVDASNMLLKILDAHSQIAEFGHVLQTGGDLVAMADRVNSVESMLLALTNNGQTEWEKFCAFYVTSCAIFFYRVVRQRPIEDEVVQSLTRRGTKLLEEEVLPGMMSHCVVFPMLIIGSHSISNQDQQVVRASLTPSLSYLSFGNMPLMLDFLQARWRKHDMQATWWEMFHNVSATPSSEFVRQVDILIYSSTLDCR